MWKSKQPVTKKKEKSFLDVALLHKNYSREENETSSTDHQAIKTLDNRTSLSIATVRVHVNNMVCSHFNHSVYVFMSFLAGR